MTGGGAVLGKHQVNGFQLGLEHGGWTKDGDKLAGVPTKVFYGDDQFRPDVGVKEVDKMLNEHKVHLMSGIIWSNVLMASVKLMIDKKVPMVITNAGASPVAGEACNPYVMSTSWNNDSNPEALGKLMSDDKLESIYMMAPNYQAGKDMISGVLRTLKGPKVLGQTFYKVGETDFQADISKLRAEKPKAVFLFGPGAMGIGFIKQWAASGAGNEIKLYTVFTIDNATLPAIGDAGIGSIHTAHWSHDLDNPANKKFVAAYTAKFGGLPSEFAAQSYDAALLIAAALKATGGKYEDGLALAKALRHTKYDSTRGPYEYNVNGMPIQNYYKREVIKGADGKPTIVNRGVVLSNHKDAYWEKCPADKRL
jgi:branched-chain amino acid transport system substrate-binding protein